MPMNFTISSIMTYKCSAIFNLNPSAMEDTSKVRHQTRPAEGDLNLIHGKALKIDFLCGSFSVVEINWLWKCTPTMSKRTTLMGKKYKGTFNLYVTLLILCNEIIQTLTNQKADSYRKSLWPRDRSGVNLEKFLWWIGTMPTQKKSPATEVSSLCLQPGLLTELNCLHGLYQKS